MFLFITTDHNVALNKIYVLYIFMYVHLKCAGYNYDSTSIRRPFDCLSKVIKVTVT